MLQTIAVNEDADLSPRMKRKHLYDSVSWVHILQVIDILDTIVHIINFLQSNEHIPIHKIFSKFSDLEVTLMKQLPLEKLRAAKILKKCMKRKNFM